MAKKRNVSRKAPLKAFPSESEKDSQASVTRLFDKYYYEILLGDHDGGGALPGGWHKVFAYVQRKDVLKRTVQLRQKFFAAASRKKKISALLDYTASMLNILRLGALDDEWVRLGLRIVRMNITDRRISLETRKQLRGALTDLLVKCIPSLKGKKDRPPNAVLMVAYESELSRLEGRIRKRYNSWALRKADLQEMYPEARYPFVSDRFFENMRTMKNREIVLNVLAYKYNREPTVLRDWVYEAKREQKKRNSWFYRLVDMVELV